MKNYTCIPFISLCLLLMSSTEVYGYKFGLGSCLDQDREQSIWSSIKKEELDGFIFLGDNVYGDLPNGKLLKMERAYQIQKKRLPSWLIDEKEILAIWDDHDFGLNDGGGDYPYKKDAEKMFLNFWNIPQTDLRRNREGIYFKQTKEIEGTKVEIIGLDTRYFRSKLKGKKNAYEQNNDSKATILGQDQWAWLEESISNSIADVIVILSSIQILATNHPYEKWDNFPLERKRLLEILANASKDKSIIAVTGDRHKSGIYQNKNFLEITASSLNKSASKGEETDPLLIGKTYPMKNYGLLNIEPSKNKITISIHDKNGQKLNSKTINIH
ncbi:alkaline phosphatase family protein [Pseudomonadota bacterium]|jgi:alkaline phosphatase D|nr:alkaline phosphatase family protein [Pseudomonadota bacterium]